MITDFNIITFTLNYVIHFEFQNSFNCLALKVIYIHFHNSLCLNYAQLVYCAVQNSLDQICKYLLCQTRISLQVCFFQQISFVPQSNIFIHDIPFSVKVYRITIVCHLVFIMFLNYFKYCHQILHSYHDCLFKILMNVVQILGPGDGNQKLSQG